MNEAETQEIAKLLTDAYFKAYEVEKMTLRVPFTVAEAYQIQAENIRILESAGDAITGYKMGLTSKAKMKQMGVHEPIYGVLTRKMRLESGATLSFQRKIHPKIEPEIAFVIGKNLSGKVSVDEALAACSGVCAAMEIIDSRYKNFDFTLPDVIADNCSSSAFVLGPTLKKPSELDLGNLGMFLEVNGTPVQFGSSSAIYGHPGASLAELCAMLAQQGKGLKAGDVVLAGAATAAVSVEPGQVIRTHVQDLSFVELKT